MQTDFKVKENLKYQAITAVESIVYLTIFSVIFLTMIQYLFSVVQNNRLAENSVDLEKNTLFITEHISDSFEQASAINPADSLFNNNDGALVLTIDQGGTPVNVTYSISGGRVQFTDTAGQNHYISQNQIDVTQLYFEEILDVEDNLVGARVIITIKSEDSPLTKDFETSYLIRSAL